MPVNTPILVNTTITTSGSAVHRGDIGQEVTLFWKIDGPITGTNPAITFTLQEVDPSGEIGLAGRVVTSSPISNTETDHITMYLVDSPAILVSWAVTGTSPSFGGVSLTTVSKTISNALGIMNTTGFSPDPSSNEDNPEIIVADPAGNMSIRGQVLTDEGSYRDDFTGTSISSSLTGVYAFTSGSKIVTGAGTLFTTELDTFNYIKLGSHANSVLSKIDYIESDTRLNLASPYEGATTSGSAISTYWEIITSGSGASFRVLSSSINFSLPTTNGAQVGIFRDADYLPFSMISAISLTQRIANQELIIGFQDDYTNPQAQAVFSFTGVDNTKITCRSSFASDSFEETIANIPAGVTSTAQNILEIKQNNDHSLFLINGTQVAEHRVHLPGPYMPMQQVAYIKNTGTTTSATTSSIDCVFFSNHDQLDVAQAVTVEGKPNGQPILIAFGIAGGNSALPKLINLNFNKVEGAIVANSYKRVVTYTVPVSYNAYILKHISYQNETAVSRVVAETNLGTWNNNTQVWVGDEIYTTPAWSAVAQAEVTTLFAAGAGNVVLTVTYTNNDLVSGRTGTITIPKASVVGSRWDVVLQTGDLGMVSIQNITTATVQVGEIKLLGLIQLSLHQDQSTTTQTETSYSPGAITFGAGTIIGIEYAAGTVAKQRLFDVLIQLVTQ